MGGVKMEEGEVYAIETFGTTGRGHVYGEGECSHYMVDYDKHARIPIRHKQAKELYDFVIKQWGTFAWCRKWLDQLGQTRHFGALRELQSLGVVKPYPPLLDVAGSYTAQYEHTIILR